MEDFPGWLVQGKGSGIPADAERLIDITCPRDHLVAVVWLIAEKWHLEMAWRPTSYKATAMGRYMLRIKRAPQVLWELRPFESPRIGHLHCGQCRRDLRIPPHWRVEQAVYEKEPILRVSFT